VAGYDPSNPKGEKAAAPAKAAASKPKKSNKKNDANLDDF
jgi:hypothetical protein